MGYIPGLKHDVFVSYAHEDRDWAVALEEELSERLTHRLGRYDVWQDENNIRTGQDWGAEITEAIQESAVFLAVLSRSYPSSKWCEKELTEFLRHAGARRGLDAGGFARFMKLIKFPWLRNAHEGFHPDFQHIKFFDRDRRTGQETEFRPGSAAFRKAVDKLSFDIEKLFEAMLRSESKVYVARTADDTGDGRDAIVRQLAAEGFALTPPDGALPKGLDAKTLKGFIADASVTIHLLGVGHDPEIRIQIEAAIDAGKKLIFCLMPGQGAASGSQKQLIDDVRRNRFDLADGEWALLEGRSEFQLVQDLVELLGPMNAAPVSTDDSKTRVYLLCDPTTSEDVAFAHDVQARILEQERIEVAIPEPPTANVSSSAMHERLLAECDGLLLYRAKAPMPWYSRNIADLLTIEQRRRQRQLRSKALLVEANDVAWPGLTVIQRKNPFDLGQLEAFLAPLRASAARRRDGGA